MAVIPVDFILNILYNGISHFPAVGSDSSSGGGFVGVVRIGVTVIITDQVEIATLCNIHRSYTTDRNLNEITRSVLLHLTVSSNKNSKCLRNLAPGYCLGKAGLRYSSKVVLVREVVLCLDFFYYCFRRSICILIYIFLEGSRGQS